MPTPVVIPNAMTMTLNWSGETRTWSNVIGCMGAPTLPTIDQTLANALMTALGSQANFVVLLGQLAPTVVLESVSIRDISAPNRAEFTSTSTPLAGGGTGDPLPLNVASCVTLRTAGAGKRFRGRIYFSGFTEAANDATGRMSTAAFNASTSGAQGIFAAVAAHGLQMAVLGRPRAAVTIPAVSRPALDGIATAVSGLVTRDQKWESQRRRTGRS